MKHNLKHTQTLPNRRNDRRTILLTQEDFEEDINRTIPNLFFNIKEVFHTDHRLTISIQVPRDFVDIIEKQIFGRYSANFMHIDVVAIEETGWYTTQVEG
ncbi:hypothetical protein KAR91_25040 [Candidatus Pacearchaeota archaeon]|nr:hypothetical protein [Candidatus Pacearchaeota archaeon]